METIEAEIACAIETLGLATTDVELLPNEQARKVYDECQLFFVNSSDRRWWWEDFKQPTFTFFNVEEPLMLLNQIIPKLESRVWLLIEDEEQPFGFVYDVEASVIGSLLGECSYVEYYVIAKDKRWLLCENHHNLLIGVGEDLREHNKDLLGL